MLSLFPPPQSSYPTLVGLIGIYIYIYGGVCFVALHETWRGRTGVTGFMSTRGCLEDAILSPAAPAGGCHWPVWLSLGSPLWGAGQTMGDLLHACALCLQGISVEMWTRIFHRKN